MNTFVLDFGYWAKGILLPSVLDFSHTDLFLIVEPTLVFYYLFDLDTNQTLSVSQETAQFGLNLDPCQFPRTT